MRITHRSFGLGFVCGKSAIRRIKQIIRILRISPIRRSARVFVGYRKLHHPECVVGFVYVGEITVRFVCVGIGEFVFDIRQIAVGLYLRIVEIVAFLGELGIVFGGAVPQFFKMSSFDTKTAIFFEEYAAR